MNSRTSGASRSSKLSGFTIIEVIIVLAIAGLIIVMVFLAVPSLRNSSRNNARRNDAARLASYVNDFMITNNGSQPIAFGTGPGQLDITGERWAIVDDPQNYSINTSPADFEPKNAGELNILRINLGWRCADAGPQNVGGTEFAIGFRTETLSGDQLTCLQG